MKRENITFKKSFLILFGNAFLGLVLPAILILFVIHSEVTAIQGFETLVVLAVLLLAGSPKALYSLLMRPYRISFDTERNRIMMKSLFSTLELRRDNMDSFVLDLRKKDRDPWLKIRPLQGKEIQLWLELWREQNKFTQNYNHWTHNLSFLKVFMTCIGVEKLHGVEELKRLIQTIVTEKTDSGFECYLPDESKKLIEELELEMKTLE
jgi:hypothetical protein